MYECCQTTDHTGKKTKKRNVNITCNLRERQQLLTYSPSNIFMIIVTHNTTIL
jgi:hypothetical protein